MQCFRPETLLPGQSITGRSLNCRLSLGEDMIDLPPTKNMLQLYSTGELKKNGSANLYYTRQRAGKDMGRLPCAMLDHST